MTQKGAQRGGSRWEDEEQDDRTLWQETLTGVELSLGEARKVAQDLSECRSC